jgi:hypothetical protein
MSSLKPIAGLIAMAQRADDKSYDPMLPKDQRDFHAGRREGYLKAIAMLWESEVKDIRRDILGTPRTNRRIGLHYVPMRADEID